ncbi:MAG TPA: PLD nuclease N-terminal domain-containing protein [Microthrixaceae bacterium]|nr:PLD nuclease N-terminal domain-containing protein [Microthrixaceae bacterium]
MAQKKKWSDLSTPAKVAVVVGSLVELALTAVAMRDLSKRSADEVRGPKWIWRLVSLVQPVGPILYLVLGRRSA